MLRVYCHNFETGEAREAAEAFSFSEAIQFIKVLVSVHGYDFQTIQQHDETDTNRILFDGYSDTELCYITQETI